MALAVVVYGYRPGIVLRLRFRRMKANRETSAADPQRGDDPVAGPASPGSGVFVEAGTGVVVTLVGAGKGRVAVGGCGVGVCVSHGRS